MQCPARILECPYLVNLEINEGSAKFMCSIFEKFWVCLLSNILICFKLIQHYKSNKLIEDFVGRARVGPVFLEEPTDVTSQVVKVERFVTTFDVIIILILFLVY